MYAIHEYKQFDQERFFQFLKEESLDAKHPAHVNMWNDNWIEHNNTLPFILENTTRFIEPKGNFYILTDGDAVVGCSGVYISDFSNKIAMAGTRSWITKSHRNLGLLKDYMLPEHKEWAIKNNCDHVALCFNDYNKNLIEVFKRTRLAETTNRINTRSDRNLFYSGLNQVPFQVNIQYTKQWVIYETLNPTALFNWESIRE